MLPHFGPFCPPFDLMTSCLGQNIAFYEIQIAFLHSPSHNIPSCQFSAFYFIYLRSYKCYPILALFAPPLDPMTSCLGQNIGY